MNLTKSSIHRALNCLIALLVTVCVGVAAATVFAHSQDHVPKHNLHALTTDSTNR